MVHHGLVPGRPTPNGFDLLADPRIIVHAESPGVVSLVGVKYTTARLAAERAVDAAARLIGATPRACRTGITVLPHADVADSDGMLQETARALGITLERAVQAHLAGWYGTEAPAVLRCAHAEDALARLSPDSPVIEGEAIYAVREAAAQRLEDVVFRRTSLASAGHPGDDALVKVADRMARELGWTADRRAEELARLLPYFPTGS